MSAASPTSGGVTPDRRAVQSEAAAAQAREACRDPRHVVGEFVRPAQAALGGQPCGLVQSEGALRIDRERALGAAQGRAADGLGECRLGLRHAAQVQVEAAETEVRLDQPFTQRLLQAHAHAATGGQPVGVATRRCAEQRQRPMYRSPAGTSDPAAPRRRPSRAAIGRRSTSCAVLLVASPPACDAVCPSTVPTATPTRPVPATGMSMPVAMPPSPTVKPGEPPPAPMLS